jgi:hypothetical protein
VRFTRRVTQLTRHAGVALTVCLFAWLALLPAQAGVAQDRSRSPTPQELWKAYPLDPTAAPSAQPEATSSPAALAETNREPLAAAGPRSEGGAPVIVLVLLALLTAGGAVTFRESRRRRERVPNAANVPRPRTSAVVGWVVPQPSQGGSGRFTRAAARKRGSRATAVVASARARGGPPESDAAAIRPAGDRSPVAPPAAAASPPDRRLAWTAEIEWRHADGESRFCVIARGAGTVTVAQSPPLEWPPTGPTAVQAMTDAAEKLSARLVTAGWKALPPGQSWYAKRFAWEPDGAERAEAAPVKSTAAAPHPVRRRRLALLCVLIALGTLAALQLRSGDDDARVERPAAGTATPATEPNPSRGTDLTLPLLVLLGLIPVVLVIRETRRTRR